MTDRDFRMETPQDLRNRKDQIAIFIRATREKIMCLQIDLDISHDAIDDINNKLATLQKQKDK